LISSVNGQEPLIPSVEEPDKSSHSQPGNHELHTVTSVVIYTSLSLTNCARAQCAPPLLHQLCG